MMKYSAWLLPHHSRRRHSMLMCGEICLAALSDACVQGFWPDGLYTPPTAKAWVADIQAAKRLGYNMLRKHVKVEPEQCAPDPLLKAPCMHAQSLSTRAAM